MTPRQTRRERREAERKVKKAEIKRNKAAGQPLLDLEEEFSPELIAEANAARQSVHRKAGLSTRDEAAVPAREARLLQHVSEPKTQTGDEAAFLSEPKTQTTVFVPQTTPEPTTRAETNRLNSLHSTGPRTPHGKLASSARLSQ